MHSISRAICAASVLALGIPSVAGAGPVQSQAGTRLLPGQIGAGYRAEVADIRSRAALQQQRDGGTLTARHTAYFQSKLDAAHDRLVRKLLNYNPMSVNADGSTIPPTKVPANWTVTRLMQEGTAN